MILERYRKGTPNRKMYWIQCKACGISQAHHQLAGYRTPSNAMKAWNKRVNQKVRKRMKIVIDIDENVFTRLFDNGTEDYEIVNDDLFTIAKSIRNGTPLPENATNGDMVKAMFPNLKWCINENNEVFTVNQNIVRLSLDWWNAPYKAESEVEK